MHFLPLEPELEHREFYGGARSHHPFFTGLSMARCYGRGTSQRVGLGHPDRTPSNQRSDSQVTADTSVVIGKLFNLRLLFLKRGY